MLPDSDRGRRALLTDGSGRSRISFRHVLLVGVALAAGCAATPTPDRGDTPRPVTIHVVNHGWHTGIVFPVEEIPDASWPERPHFDGARYLEVGWGDRDYYTERDPGVLDALGAALFPGRGVLHIVGLRSPPGQAFPASDSVALPITRDGLERLIAHMRASYERGDDGEPIPLGPGLYGASRFYASRGRFHLFNTCNRWTARALQHAGVPISSAFVWTADSVVDRARDAAARLRGGDASAADEGP